MLNLASRIPSVRELSETSLLTGDEIDDIWLRRLELRSFRDVAEYLEPAGFLEKAGSLAVLFVDNRCGLIGSEVVIFTPSAKGRDLARQILSSASNCHAYGIILATNNSQSDRRLDMECRELTTTLNTVGEAIDVLLLNHFVFTPRGWEALSRSREESDPVRASAAPPLDGPRAVSICDSDDPQAELSARPWKILPSDPAPVHANVANHKGAPNLPGRTKHSLADPTALAAEIYGMRRARNRLIPKSLIGETAWDILLALYSEHPGKLTINGITQSSSVPTTTALRWIGALEAEGLVTRTAVSRDASDLVSLTPKGHHLMETCLRSMLSAKER